MKRSRLVQKKPIWKYCAEKRVRRLATAPEAKSAPKPRSTFKRPTVAKLGHKATAKRKPLKKQSRARAREMRIYHEERRDWLALPEHAACAICLCLGQSPRPATEVHHSRGRVGRLLRDQRFWVASCRSCRDVPHERPNWAREVGILSSAADWNTFPRE